MSDKVSDEVVRLPEDLAAVCLDANAMSRGRLDTDAIEDLVEIITSQELEVRVLIPEPVMWEWAEHLASELTDARSAYDGARQRAAQANVAGLLGPAWTESTSPDNVVSEMESALREIEGVDILALTTNRDVAVEAIRDQVMLRGAARRKSSVKTGAADSASFRLAEAEHAHLGGTLLIVSGDQDAARYFSGKRAVVVVSSLSRAKAGIVAMRTGSEIAADRVREAVKHRLPNLTRRELGQPAIERSGPLPDERQFGETRIVHLDYELTAVDSVTSVSTVEVSQSDGYAFVLVEALVSVERDLQVLSERNGVVEMEVETFDGLGATVEVSAESDNGVDWDVVVDRVRLH